MGGWRAIRRGSAPAFLKKLPDQIVDFFGRWLRNFPGLYYWQYVAIFIVVVRFFPSQDLEYRREIRPSELMANLTM